jgi:hypothetical protein
MRLRTVCLALLLGALLVPSAAAAPGQSVTFEAPRELLDDATRDATLDEIASLGVDRVRVLVYWDQYAPLPAARSRPEFDASDPESYPPGTWDRLDRVVDAADERGMTVQPALTGPVPRWATRGARDRVTEPSAREFEAFATAVGRRYGEQVSVWSIWNEPNHPQFLRPQFRRRKAASPEIYRGLFLAGARGLRSTAANVSDAILAGETAPRGTPRVVAPIAFLRGALCLTRTYRRARSCERLPADGWAHHPYTTSAGPHYRPARHDDVTIGVLSRLTRALDRAAAAGAIAAGLPVHLTEFGVQSEPDPFIGVSLERQAEYLAIAEHIAWRNSRVAAFSQYLLTDDQPRAGSRAARYSGFESGLRLSDGRLKPAWHGFRLPLTASRRGRDAVLWGHVRPAEGATEVTLVGVDRDGTETELRTLATAQDGSFTLRVRHRAGRRYRTRWKAPDGAVYDGAAVRAY